MKKPSASFIISCLALGVSAFTLFTSYNGHCSSLEDDQKSFLKNVLHHVKACIAHDDNIRDKAPIYELIEEIERNSQVVETGNDDLRIKYVASQGCFEHVLACSQVLGEVGQLIGVIHTPTVATPLCVKPDGPYEEVLDTSIRHDLNKLLTVRSRAHTVREFLHKGGQLYMVYPQGGQSLRTEAQLAIYREELDRFAGSLFDWMLSSNHIEPDMIGATYLFRDTKGQVYAFCIKSRQAIDNQSNAEWGLWLGSIDEPAILQRVNLIFNYIVENDGPDARELI